MREEAFNWRARDEVLGGLGNGYDLIIIGGGIIGAGISLEASKRGYRVLLIEKGDIGSGTSSRSSRLIHGGLRYLKYGKLKLVLEASRERYHLWTAYPHLVRPIAFLIPFFKGVGEGPLVTLLGLWLYDLLSGFRNFRNHRRLNREEVLAEEPHLQSDGLLGGAIYYDCGTDDFRLVLLNAIRAHLTGADILTYSKVESLIMRDGRPGGVRFRDLLHGGTHEVLGRVIVNATGPWSDEVRLMLPSSERRLRPTKGVHIFVPHSRVGNRNAVIMRSPDDERVVFAMRWHDLTLVGTTDTDYEGDPDDVKARGEDVTYLLESVNHSFPQANLKVEDVVSSFASLRPLIAEYGKPESEVTRDIKIVQDARGLISILGGKLTTYRRAAKTVMQTVGRQLTRKGGTSSRLTPLPEVSITEAELRELRARASNEQASLGLDPEVVDHLIASYGPACRHLLDHSENDMLRRRIVPGLPYIFAEVVYAVEHEMALKLEDVLVRRTGVMHEDLEHGLEVAEEVARLMAGDLGWSVDRVRREVEEYRQIVVAAEAFRGEA